LGLFMFLELAFLLPTVLYGVYRLAVQRRGTSGGDELLFFVYALEVAFTTLVCIYNTFYLDDALFPVEVRREMQVQLYGPFLVIRKSLWRLRWPLSDVTSNHRGHRHGGPDSGPYQGGRRGSGRKEVAVAAVKRNRGRWQQGGMKGAVPG
jgi:hypothetical protein